MYNITIIICHKDYQDFLKESIDSALKQDYPNINICVIDDASVDNKKTKKIVEESLKTTKNKLITADLKLYTDDNESHSYIELSKNVGPSAARNIAINLYKESTDYFFILDADDIMYENKVSKIIKFIDRSPNKDMIGVVYADTITFNEDGVETKEFRESFSIERLLSECIVHSGACVSKRAILSVAQNGGQYYDEEMRTCEDYDLWIRIARRYAILHYPEFLTKIRVHRNNSTNSVPKEIWIKNWNRIREKLNAT